MKKLFVVLALSVTSNLAISQDTQAAKIPNPFGFLQSIFSPKSASLAKLIEERKILDADDYLGKERQYFWIENKKEQLDLLKRLAASFNATWEADFDVSMAALSKVTEFGQDRWIENRNVEC